MGRVVGRMGRGVGGVRAMQREGLLVTGTTCSKIIYISPEIVVSLHVSGVCGKR